jgi:dolichol kinase
VSANPNLSMLAELQANLKSIVRQVSLVFLGFLVLLLVTGGHLPSSWLVTYIVIGVLFVAWDEYRRNFHLILFQVLLRYLANERSRLTDSTYYSLHFLGILP